MNSCSITREEASDSTLRDQIPGCRAPTPALLCIQSSEVKSCSLQLGEAWVCLQPSRKQHTTGEASRLGVNKHLHYFLFFYHLAVWSWTSHLPSLSFASSSVNQRPFSNDASCHLCLLCASYCAGVLKSSLIFTTVLMQCYTCLKDEETSSEKLSHWPKVAQSWAARVQTQLWFQRPLPPSKITSPREKWKLKKLFQPKHLHSFSPRLLLVSAPVLGNAVVWGN